MWRGSESGRLSLKTQRRDLVAIAPRSPASPICRCKALTLEASQPPVIVTHVSRAEAEIAIRGQLVAADDAVGESRTFTLTYTGGFDQRVLIGHAGWPQEQPAPSDVQVDELGARDWLRITAYNGKGRIFAVTAEGHHAWHEHLAQTSHVPGRVDLTWTAARPFLQELYEVYRDQGAPALGVNLVPLLKDETRKRQVEALVPELVRGGWLEVGRDSAAGPVGVRPTTKTLQVFAGWPSGPADDVVEDLASAIQAEIDKAADPDEKSRLVQLRDGVLGIGRDPFLHWAEQKVSGAL